MFHSKFPITNWQEEMKFCFFKEYLNELNKSDN